MGSTILRTGSPIVDGEIVRIEVTYRTNNVVVITKKDIEAALLNLYNNIDLEEMDVHPQELPAHKLDPTNHAATGFTTKVEFDRIEIWKSSCD